MSVVRFLAYNLNQTSASPRMPPPSLVVSSTTIPIRTIYQRPNQCHCSLSAKNSHKLLSQYHRIRINVSGTIHETFQCILDNFPNTLLGDPNRRRKYWVEKRKEYFFDAHQKSFEAIFQFYQTGYLRRPSEVPLQTFLEQMEIFEMDRQTMTLFCRQEGIIETEQPPSESRSMKEELWNMFEYPNHSRGGFIISVMSMTMIIFSVALLCMTTIPSIPQQTCKTLIDIKEGGRIVKTRVPNLENEFFLLETCCIVWFTFEFVVRFFTCPDKRIFMHDCSNILDLCAILPYYLFIVVLNIIQDCDYAIKGGVLVLLRILRILRIFKLTRHNRSLQLLRLAFMDSFHDLIACFFLITLTALIFAGTVYYVEIEFATSHFQSMEEAIWWAFATMTTVGYGDVVPQTRAGKAVGTLCILLGTIVLALPAPIIVTNFNRYYRNETGRGLEEADMKKH